MEELVQEISTQVDNLQDAVSEEDASEALACIGKIEVKLRALKEELADLPEPTEA